mgnify:CR=1 FL=1
MTWQVPKLMQSKEEIEMKKYTKPMANVVELSVKESLSALPNNISKVQKMTIASNVQYMTTVYSNKPTYPVTE